MKFYEVATYKEMSRKAANIISAEIISNPKAVIGLATGSTPIGTYNQLIEWCKKGDLDFAQVTTVNLDEYYGLSGENEQSYRYFMNDHLFDHVNIDKNNTHVPNGLAKDPEAEGERYDAFIKEIGGIDLQLLGIGIDGHIGFNEPDDVFVKETHLVDLDESTIQANSRFFESADEVPKKALTMGMMSIMQAKKILMVVSGENKEQILKEALTGPITPKNPASILQVHPDVTVIFTKQAN
ncbi:MAG: glucosamine-6-phosphate deaminase [Ruminococcaceae bacterium]|nr:glucosamine-6-phosphate deaminase [Oscillospiraceae bacterium]